MILNVIVFNGLMSHLLREKLILKWKIFSEEKRAGLELPAS